MPVWVQDGTHMDTVLLLGQRGEPGTLPHVKHSSWHKVSVKSGREKEKSVQRYWDII